MIHKNIKQGEVLKIPLVYHYGVSAVFLLFFRKITKKISQKSGRYYQIGWKTGDETEQKSAQIYYMFINHRSEILSMKEQVQLIRGVLAA